MIVAGLLDKRNMVKSMKPISTYERADPFSCYKDPLLVSHLSC